MLLTKKNFSIIELLVVISLFVILLSLLQPSLNKMFEIARKQECSQQLKTVGQAMYVYTDDNYGELPGPIAYWLIPHSGRGLGKLFVAGDYIDSEPYVYATKPTDLRSISLFRCPSNQESETKSRLKLNQTSYLVGNKRTNPDNLNYFGIENQFGVMINQSSLISAVSNPSRSVLFYDVDNLNSNQTTPLAPLHIGAGRNVILFDLSMTEQDSFTKEFYW